jgi:hypothetical protein
MFDFNLFPFLTPPWEEGSWRGGGGVLPLEPGKWTENPFAVAVAEHLGEMEKVEIATGPSRFWIL